MDNLGESASLSSGSRRHAGARGDMVVLGGMNRSITIPTMPVTMDGENRLSQKRFGINGPGSYGSSPPVIDSRVARRV